MSRKALFDFARPLAPQGQLTPAMVAAGDAFADALGLPRAQAPAPANDAGRRVSKAGIDLIHSFESCKLTAYPDPGSSDGHPWTIGWGSTGPGIAKGVVWTQQQADERFAADLSKFERGVTETLDGSPASQSQFDTLVSFSYNVGLGALRDSTLLKKHRAGDYAGAREQFSRWVNNAGKPMKGLIRRRAAEAALYAS